MLAHGRTQPPPSGVGDIVMSRCATVVPLTRLLLTSTVIRLADTIPRQCRRGRTEGNAAPSPECRLTHLRFALSLLAQRIERVVHVLRRGLVQRQGSV